MGDVVILDNIPMDMTVDNTIMWLRQLHARGEIERISCVVVKPEGKGAPMIIQSLHQIRDTAYDAMILQEHAMHESKE